MSAHVPALVAPAGVRRGSLLAAVVLCAYAPAALAADPAVRSLYPTGVQGGGEVEVTAALDGLAWPPRVRIEGPTGEVSALTATPLAENGKVRVRAAADVPPGRYWLRFHGDEGAATPRPFLVGALAERLEAEPNDALAEAEAVEQTPCVVNGRLEKNGDSDAFALSLRAGDVLVAWVDAHRLLGSPMDATLQLTDAAGFVLAENDDELGLDPRLVFRARTDGRHVVRVFAFPAEPDSSIRFSGAETYVYRLTLTTGACAAHALPFAVTRGVESAVRLCGWNLADDDAATLIVPPLAECGLHLVPAGASAGLIELLVEPHATAVEAQPHGNGFVQPVEIPCTISGRIDRPGDVDRFAVTLAKGATLAAVVRARRSSSRLDGVLRIRAHDEKALAENDDRGGVDPELEFKAPEDGRYIVEVLDRYGHGGPLHVYALQLTAAEPSWSLAVGQDHFRLEGGGPLELPVEVRRIRGFDAEVTVRAEGLPAGVRCAAVSSPADGEAAKKATLRFESSGDAWSGPFRVAGESAAPEGTPPERRVATAALVGPGARTDTLWLTGIPAAPPAAAAAAASAK